MIPVDRHKRALVKWKEYQSRQPTEIEKEQWKNQFNGRIAGWAMLTGRVSGIVALDFDGEIGIQTLAQLELKPNVKTPSGAYHVWIKSPDSPVRTGAKDTRWPGMELKGDGGYVITEGTNIISSHEEEPILGSYEILDSEPTALNELDDELMAFITNDVISEAVERSKDGRNQAGFWLARQLRDNGFSKEDAKQAVLDYFFEDVSQEGHPYTKDELLASVDSAYKKASSTVKQGGRDDVLNLVLNSGAEIWHDNTHGYLTTDNDENIRIRSRRCKELIASQYYSATNKAVGSSVLSEVIETLDAIAKSQSPYHETKTRVGWLDGNCYYDLGNKVYKIDANGYAAMEKSPIKFIRNDTLGLMPEPRKHSDGWSLLRKYVNVLDEDWPLVRAAIIAAFIPNGAFPITALTGSHGSGKSTSVSAMVMCIDPRQSIESCRDTLPKDRRNLAISAKMSHMLAYDNESHITKEISDALAMICTGGQFKTRTLYSDDEMSVFAVRRPILINSIGDIVTESDLLDRSIIIECPALTDYWSESDMWPLFEQERPFIIHAIFESVSKGIRNISKISVNRPDRLVDFIRWSIACGIENFEEAYKQNKLKAPFIAINNSYMGALITRLILEPPSQRRIEANRLAASATNKPELADYDWVGSLSMLHEFGSHESTEWYKSLMGAINGFKRVKSDLVKAGVEIIEFQHLHQAWIAIKGERSNEQG